jgi:hypothetical protein
MASSPQLYREDTKLKRAYAKSTRLINKSLTYSKSRSSYDILRDL